jgi:hypothetical protein
MTNKGKTTRLGREARAGHAPANAAKTSALLDTRGVYRGDNLEQVGTDTGRSTPDPFDFEFIPVNIFPPEA